MYNLPQHYTDVCDGHEQGTQATELVGMPYKSRNGQWRQAMKASDCSGEPSSGDHVLLTEMHTSYTYNYTLT